MRTVLVQAAATTDKDENLQTVRRLFPSAAAERPDLVVCPEAFMCEFGEPDKPIADRAEPLDGPFVSALSALAREHATAVVAGMFERSPDSARPFNTLVALGPDGVLTASYRKIHMYDAFGHRESDKLVAGKPEAVVFDVAGVQVGLMTCYDLRFPELGRALVDAGADVLCVPAAWVRGPLKEDHWTTLLAARAIENTCYVAAAGQCGERYVGHSRLIDPLGVPLAGLGEAEGIAAGIVRPQRITEARRRNPAVGQRRFAVVPRSG